MSNCGLLRKNAIHGSLYFEMKNNDLAARGKAEGNNFGMQKNGNSR